jgi:hypothetical protein
MCLIVKKKPYEAKIARKDIECFKVLEKHTYRDGSARICTPYKCTVIDKNIINGKKPMFSQFLARNKNGVWGTVNVTEKKFKNERIIPNDYSYSNIDQDAPNSILLNPYDN